MNTQEVIARYVKIRDHIKGLETAHEEAIKPYKLALEAMETWLGGEMNRTGQTSLVAKGSGTAYKSTIMRCSVSDRPALEDWALENRRWDIFGNTLSKDVVRDVVDCTKEPPPGVKVEFITNVNVKRS